jgi:hypothetical protein
MIGDNHQQLPRNNEVHVSISERIGGLVSCPVLQLILLLLNAHDSIEED